MVYQFEKVYSLYSRYPRHHINNFLRFLSLRTSPRHSRYIPQEQIDIVERQLTLRFSLAQFFSKAALSKLEKHCCMLMRGNVLFEIVVMDHFGGYANLHFFVDVSHQTVEFPDIHLRKIVAETIDKFLFLEMARLCLDPLEEIDSFIETAVHGDPAEQRFQRGANSDHN